jgi:hypothetical protein
MADLRFTETDADILYSMPMVKTDVTTIVRYYLFINRTGAPTYEEIAGVLAKAIQAGIMNRNGGKFIVESTWFERIHQADDTSENEIESMLKFEEWFVNQPFEPVSDAVFVLSKSDYAAVLKKLGATPMSHE